MFIIYTELVRSDCLFNT